MNPSAPPSTANGLPPRTRPLALIVGQDRPETPLRYLARGLAADGWQVDSINDDGFIVRWPGLLGKLVQRAGSGLSKRALGDEIVARAEATRPQVLLFLKILPLSRLQLARLRALGCKLAMWYPDVSFDHGRALDSAMFDSLDLFVTTKHYHLEYLARAHPRLQTAFVPHGYCDDVHHPSPPDGPKPFDVVYVGNHSSAKAAAIGLLARERPGLRIAVAGGGWPRRSAWAQFPPMAGEEMARLLSSGKIALGMHYGPHGLHGWEDSTSARSFEIPACGAFMLHPDNPEIRELFAVDDEIGVYPSLAALPGIADRWLADDPGREAAARRAMVRARPAYSYSARGAAIGQWLRERGAAGC